MGYLNARPLTWALDRDPDRWRVRYDVPSVCASLLHEGDVDLGLIPSIEYLQSDDYRFVPGVGIGSRGPVASVALYTRKPIEEIRRIALDTSSRTSVTLIQVLCHHHFHIDPSFVPHGPDLAAMTTTCDAGLLIGDPAFDADHDALGLQKIDLGEVWTAMTGLPFIYAAWTGRPARSTTMSCGASAGAGRGCGGDGGDRRGVRGGRCAVAPPGRQSYLRDNVKYGLGPRKRPDCSCFSTTPPTWAWRPRRRTLEFF